LFDCKTTLLLILIRKLSEKYQYVNRCAYSKHARRIVIYFHEELRTMHKLREALSAAENLYHHVSKKHHHHESADSESTPVPVLDVSITDSSATAPAESPTSIELYEETKYKKISYNR